MLSQFILVACPVLVGSSASAPQGRGLWRCEDWKLLRPAFDGLRLPRRTRGRSDALPIYSWKGLRHLRRHLRSRCGARASAQRSRCPFRCAFFHFRLRSLRFHLEVLFVQIFGGSSRLTTDRSCRCEICSVRG